MMRSVVVVERTEEESTFRRLSSDELAYRKTTHAPLIGQHIGLHAITGQCAHFAAWVGRLRPLQPL